MARSPFSGETYYSGAENDDVAWIRRFIMKNGNKKSRRIAQFEVDRLEIIMEKLVSHNEKTDLSKENNDLRKIISGLDEEYLKVNAQKPPLVNKPLPPKIIHEKVDSRQNYKIIQKHDPIASIILMCISIPMMLMYMFDWSFWGSKVCLGIGWVIFLLVGFASSSENW